MTDNKLTIWLSLLTGALVILVIGLIVGLAALSSDVAQLDETEDLSVEKPYDIPMVLNDSVENHLEYFKTRGKDVFQRWLGRAYRLHLHARRTQKLRGTLEMFFSVSDARKSDQTFGKLVMSAKPLVKKQTLRVPYFGTCIIFHANRNCAQHI